MANEIEILTLNDAGTSWVDLIPGQVSTGYQAQNTNLAANRNGIDRFSPYYDSINDEIVIPESGLVDEGGLPFVVKSEARIDASSMAVKGVYYLILTAGTATTQRSIALTIQPGTYDASKNGYYYNGYRVLNWLLSKDAVDNIVFSYRFSQNNTIYAMDQNLRKEDYVEHAGLAVKNDRVDSSFAHIESAFSAPASNIDGLATDGTNLYSRDTSNGNFYKHSGFSTTIDVTIAKGDSTTKSISFTKSVGVYAPPLSGNRVLGISNNGGTPKIYSWDETTFANEDNSTLTYTNILEVLGIAADSI